MAKTISDIRKVVKKLLSLLEENGVVVEKVILYGSYAMNCAREDSDIDLIIISRSFKKYPPLKRLEFLSLISWNLPEPFEIIGYTPDEVKGKEGKSIFWDKIQGTGKTIFKKAA